MHQMKHCTLAMGSILHFVRRTCLPYCIVRLESGRWVSLNREYKPLGVDAESGGGYDYSRCHGYALDLSPEQRKAIAYPADDRAIGEGKSGDKGDWIYLYFDGNTPFRDSVKSTREYMLRLFTLEDAIAKAIMFEEAASWSEHHACGPTQKAKMPEV